MELDIEVYDCFCSLSVFKVNGIDADECDFVDQYDHSPETAEDYGCGDMRADIIPATGEVLKKYGISNDEYIQIAEQVAEKVSFGECGWCV